jgi:lactose/L-arabinose transport system permease protein
MIRQSRVDYAGLMLGSFIATLRAAVIFFSFQRQDVAGLLGGAIKG